MTRIFHLWRWEPGVPRPQTLQVFETCAALARAGAEVNLVANCPPDGHTLSGVLQEQGWTMPPGLNVAVLPRARGLASLMFRQHLLKFVADRRPGLVLARRLDLAATLCPWLGGVMAPRIHMLCEWHEIPSVLADLQSDGKKARWWNTIEHQVLTQVPLHSFISNGLAEDVARRYQAPAISRVIPNGSWPSNGAASPPHRRLVLFSFFRKYSEVKQLKQILDNLPPGWTLHVHAPGSPPLNHLQLRWGGLVSLPDSLRLMAESSAVLCPFSDDYSRRYWDSPLKLWQALGSGRPVITTDLPGVREVVGDPPCVLLLPPDNFGPLGHLLNQVEHDHRSLAPLVEAARLRAHTYTWDHRAAQILALIREAHL